MENTIMNADPKLAEIVRRLIDAYQPLRVFLFGSSARGDAGPNSDCDIIIIVPDDATPIRKRSKLAYECLWGTGRASDVLVWTSERFACRSSVITSLPATVLREGYLLYDAQA